MKKELKVLFKEIYPEKRLLAIQLNGFSHKVFYDDGKRSSAVQVDEYSAYTLCERQAVNVLNLLGSIPHYPYKGDPKEIVYISPDQR